MSVQVPTSTRNLRACMICSIVQSSTQFTTSGCPNCPFLELQGNNDHVQECTSAVFEGMIALNDPRTSWVAKWQRLTDYQPGVYAVKVVGTLNEDRIVEAQENGVKYFPRDGTKPEDYEAQSQEI